jgi:hypothetical protein
MAERHKLRLRAGIELPDLGVTWLSEAKAVIPMLADGYTCEFRIDTLPTIRIGILGGAQVGVTLANSAPNVTIAFPLGILDGVRGGYYSGQLRAMRSDGKDRDPIDFDVMIERLIPHRTQDLDTLITATATVTATDVLT